MRPVGTDLETLKNIGPTSAEWLWDAGITSRAELERVGAVMAYLIVRHHRPGVNALLLFALHGALTDTHWAAIDDDAKVNLRAEADRGLQVG